jgi:hypothetical protein
MFFGPIRKFLSRSSTRCFSQERHARLRFGGNRFRPRIEVLEERSTPAVVNWTNPAGGTWETPGNWSSGSLPGPQRGNLSDGQRRYGQLPRQQRQHCQRDFQWRHAAGRRRCGRHECDDLDEPGWPLTNLAAEVVLGTLAEAV